MMLPSVSVILAMSFLQTTLVSVSLYGIQFTMQSSIVWLVIYIQSVSFIYSLYAVLFSIASFHVLYSLLCYTP